MSLYCNLLGCRAELKFSSLVLVERRWRRRCLGAREWSGDPTRGWSATSRRGKEFSSQASEPGEEVCFSYHVEQLLFYPLMDVFHVRLYIDQSRSFSYVLWFPRRIVDERLEPLGVSEEAVEAFALWGVSNTLHDGGAEVRFREEGITNQVLVFLWREERVFGNDVGVLCPYSLGSV